MSLASLVEDAIQESGERVWVRFHDPNSLDGSRHITRRELDLYSNTIVQVC